MSRIMPDGYRNDWIVWCKRRSRMMGNYQVRFRGRGRGQSHREPSPLPDGVEDFEEINIRHSKFAANRFAHEAAPALAHFADSSPRSFVHGIKQARERIVARKDEDREDFLRKRGFSKAETGKIIASVLAEEGRPPESLYDFVQGITAHARSKTNQDARLEIEGKARKILEKVN